MAIIALSRMHRLALAWGLLVGVWAWVAALAVVPLIVAGSHRTGPVLTASMLVYLLGGLVCHQHAPRTFHLWGAPLPVCARCVGLYTGAGLGVAAGIWVAHRQRWRRLRDSGGESLHVWRLGLLAGGAPTAATFALEKFLGVPVTNGQRAAAGLILGACVGWIVASSLRGREPFVDGEPEVD